MQVLLPTIWTVQEVWHSWANSTALYWQLSLGEKTGTITLIMHAMVRGGTTRVPRLG